MIATEFELQPVQSIAVDSLNVKHKLQLKRVKQFCQLFCIMYTFQIKLMIITVTPRWVQQVYWQNDKQEI